MASLFYVYGIVAADTAVSAAPEGLDDAAVTSITEGDVTALVSELSGDEYAPEHIAAASGNMDWMSGRALAHDRVLTWASDRGPVVPLAMFTSTFASPDAVRAMLRERNAELQRVLVRVGRGREYA